MKKSEPIAQVRASKDHFAWTKANLTADEGIALALALALLFFTGGVMVGWYGGQSHQDNAVYVAGPATSDQSSDANIAAAMAAYDKIDSMLTQIQTYTDQSNSQGKVQASTATPEVQ